MLPKFYVQFGCRIHCVNEIIYHCVRSSSRRFDNVCGVFDSSPLQSTQTYAATMCLTAIGSVLRELCSFCCKYGRRISVNSLCAPWDMVVDWRGGAMAMTCVSNLATVYVRTAWPFLKHGQLMPAWESDVAQHRRQIGQPFSCNSLGYTVKIAQSHKIAPLAPALRPPL